MVELSLQILLVVLLLLTITWCVVVHYRLGRLRSDRGELETFIAALGEATGRAEEAVRQMREANAAVDSTARDQERRARQQSAELARLVENAVRVVERLDAAVEQGATRLAELRTPRAALEAPAPPAEARAAVRSRPRPTTEPPMAKPVIRPAPEADAAAERRRAPSAGPAGAARRVRSEGRLDGLLHGQLREALQGLR